LKKTQILSIFISKKNAKMKNLVYLSVLFLFFSCSKPESNLQVAKIYGSGMVVQRNQPVKVWGSAAPGTKIDITFFENTASATAGDDGKWMVNLPEIDLGGPLEMKIQAHDTTIVFTDILAGDVWICSGQSNMEWALANTENGDVEANRANYPNIRFCDIEKDLEFFPLDTLRNELFWYKAESSEALAAFSAVGYYYGKELHESLDIPIGLVGANWGGTIAETWMSLKAATALEDFNDKLTIMAQQEGTIEDANAALSNKMQKWKEEELMHGIGFDERWFLPETDITTWNTMKVPAYWEEADDNLKNFDGAVWFRTTFDPLPEFSGKDIEMWFGKIDDHSQAWVNGVYLGETFFPGTWTNYTAPDSILKEKNNVLVIRVFDTGLRGGFSGNPSHFDYFPVNETEIKLSTAGTWHYKAGKAYEGDEQTLKGIDRIGANSFPTLLYNAMIHPVINFPIKGAIWYQGESNASRAYQYRKVFPAMITDWRTQWEQGDFPFYYVQLANFMERNTKPEESEWAELREAQTMTLALPNTGMATIIDIGEADDIHPRNKKDVGKRLARQALAKTYNKDIEYSGPTYDTHIVEGNKVTIYLEHADSILTRDNKPVKGFTIAGADRVFYQANASIEGNSIIVSHPKVSEPVAVRYAWANNPATNLYNSEGLPMVPFRTDEWPGLTVDAR